MPKPTEEQQELWHSALDITPFGREPKPEHPFELYEIDEYPLEDDQGRRQAEGFKISWEAVVQDSWCNLTESLHGAASAWLVDTCTSAALVGLHTPTFWGPPFIAGASIALDMQYFHPAKLGTKLLIQVEILKITTTLATLKGDIKDFSTGKLFASGTHIKAWKGLPRAKL